MLKKPYSVGSSLYVHIVTGRNTFYWPFGITIYVSKQGHEDIIYDKLTFSEIVKFI